MNDSSTPQKALEAVRGSRYAGAARVLGYAEKQAAWLKEVEQRERRAERKVTRKKRLRLAGKVTAFLVVFALIIGVIIAAVMGIAHLSQEASKNAQVAASASASATPSATPSPPPLVRHLRRLRLLHLSHPLSLLKSVFLVRNVLVLSVEARRVSTARTRKVWLKLSICYR